MAKRHVYEVGDGATEELSDLKRLHDDVMATQRMLEEWVRVMDAQARARRNASAIGRALEWIRRRLGVREVL